MKHTLFILGALFAGTFLFAEELDVNGNFMKTSPQDAKQAAGWTKSWSNMKDIGNVTLEKGSADGRNAVRIRTTRLLTPYTSLVEIPVTAGKEITISFDAKGKGRISDCFYVHGVAPKKDIRAFPQQKCGCHAGIQTLHVHFQDSPGGIYGRQDQKRNSRFRASRSLRFCRFRYRD